MSDAAPTPSERDRLIAAIAKIEATSQARDREIARLRRLVYGASAGQHLYRAWQVLRGNPNYRRKPDPATVDPATVEGWHDLVIEGLRIRFHKAALADNRGTGRVARELFVRFEALAQASAGAPPGPSDPVHFFAAPHWGPATLPPRSCVVIHDAIPMIAPGYPEGQRAIFEQRCRSVIGPAEKIVAISRSCADDIVRLLDAPREKIVVIPNGVSRLPVAPAKPPPLPPSPYLVYVGGGDSHKNLPVVFEALALPGMTGLRLAMVGENTSLRPLAEAFGVADRVRFLGRLDDDAAGHVVAHALAMVFPSLHEGFGLPPLEAALLGVPSVCSRRPAMTELLEGAALFADPNAPEEWAARIRELAGSPPLRQDVAANACLAASALDWNKTARAYIDALRDMSRGQPETDAESA